MTNDPNERDEKKRDDDEISVDDLESVNGGLSNRVGTVVTDNKHPEGARSLT